MDGKYTFYGFIYIYISNSDLKEHKWMKTKIYT